ncbi:sugar-transfer associated ATP-grasp domain-containing protein [Gemmatimonadota bacterium Y43]|uniref:sugar-transfer associated ATP-grasp domain-containing protein n=1 Tax=Gaopeijia maritima TaxID=3119007 RepID=UPI00328CCE9B
MVVPRIARAVAQRLSRARRLVELDFSPRLPPWSRLRHPTSEVQRLRRDATRVGPLASRRPGERAVFAAAAIVWHLRAPWDAVSAAALHGRRIREAGGPGRWTLFRDSLAAAFAWNVSPRVFHALRLWDSATGLSAETVVQDAEIGIHQMIANRGLDVGRVADKARFAELCTSHDLPVVRTLAVLRGADTDLRTVLPAAPVFFKPLEGSQGEGAQRWLFDPGDERWVRKGRRLDRGELLSSIHAFRRGRGFLVQECLVNHPELESLSGPTLSSLRIMTRVSDDGAVSVACVVLKVGRQGAEVDNRHAGGIVCAVDPATGRVGAGLSSTRFGAITAHPDSGAELEGRVLTVHRDAMAVATRAHATLPDLPRTVGWDIAVTPEGPVIIEANSMWGAGIVQWALQGPVPLQLIEPYLR